MTHDTMTLITAEDRAAARKPITVAVDGSEHNRSAVAWASFEARATGRELVLLTAIDDHLTALPYFTISNQDERALDMLSGVRNSIRHLVDDGSVHTEAVVGAPAAVLVERAALAHLMVVGRRGLGSFGRMIVGSTSIAVAGRAAAPTVIVPDSWRQEDQVGAAIVVGVNPYRPEHALLQTAFARARRTGSPLTAVHGWEAPTAYAADQASTAGPVTGWEEASNEFDRVLDDWRSRFPQVELVTVHAHSHPAMAVLEAAAGTAQLVILGRHTRGRLSGFAFGSVTRAVLHYADCPVMVVPDS